MLYLAKCYVKGPKGEPGWEIKFAWVQAGTPTEARTKVAARVPFFDEVITLSESTADRSRT